MASSFSSAIENAKLSYSVHIDNIDSPVSLDVEMWEKIVLNLISNASKFTDEGSITVEALVQKGPTGKMEALINVIDTGPGISEEDQEKLFKAFSQVDGSATRKSGSATRG